MLDLLSLSALSSCFSFAALSFVGGFSVGAGVKLSCFRDLYSSPRSIFQRPESGSKLMQRPFLPLRCAAPFKSLTLMTAPGCMPFTFGHLVCDPSGRTSFVDSLMRASGFVNKCLPLAIIYSWSLALEQARL